MEHIIRKVIKEVSDSKEESIKKIEEKKKYIGKMLPIISEYFEGTFGDDLFELIGHILVVKIIRQTLIF